jgi:hypothetical protein
MRQAPQPRRSRPGRDRDEREGGEYCAPSVVNASESGPWREGTLSHGGDLQTAPKTGKRRLPDQGPLLTSHSFRALVNTPTGVSRVGVLGL